MAPDDVTWLPAWRLAALVSAKQISPVELTQHFLDRINEHDHKLNSFLTVSGDLAMQQAKDAESAIQGGRSLGPLAGVPLAVKDQFDTKGIRTTSGSLLFAEHVPEHDSVYVERLRAAGAVIVGKTNTPEFGLFWRTCNKLGPECLNPWNTDRTSGGSSGGAAASLAAGLVPAGVGSDRGGSIRIPSAFCGVVGLLPSAGRVPNHGGFGRALWFRGVGPMTRDVRDAALILGILAGGDRRDPTCSWDHVPEYSEGLESAKLTDLRIGWWHDSGDGAEHDGRVMEVVAKAVHDLEPLSAAVVETRFVDTVLAKEVFWVLNDAERYGMFGQALLEDPAKRCLLCPYVIERLEHGRIISAAEVLRALYAWQQVKAEAMELFEHVDVVVSPTVGQVAPPVAQETPRHSITSSTYMANFVGLCAITLPCGLVDGLPVGLQVISKPGKEALMLRVARAVEELLGQLGPCRGWSAPAATLET